ncbi:hypothetical protein DPMN_004434 [Dreissena polymorpha]|uniref:Uncharacterized protein n=1 Tax=Dreissena polymorpha TaxID=45954 RepID=A0A9D4MNJ2_DREPO|nr:hypothetical protein DPMN_004434 [Dreissena polymorpha]
MSKPNASEPTKRSTERLPKALSGQKCFGDARRKRKKRKEAKQLAKMKRKVGSERTKKQDREQKKRDREEKASLKIKRENRQGVTVHLQMRTGRRRFGTWILMTAWINLMHARVVDPTRELLVSGFAVVPVDPHGILPAQGTK